MIAAASGEHIPSRESHPLTEHTITTCFAEVDSYFGRLSDSPLHGRVLFRDFVILVREGRRSIVDFVYTRFSKMSKPS